MNIRISRFVVRSWDAIGDWSNVPVWTRGRLEVRRIDVMLVLFGVVCVGWYGHTGGWPGALMGGSFYVLVMMMALWIL